PRYPYPARQAGPHPHRALHLPLRLPPVPRPTTPAARAAPSCVCRRRQISASGSRRIGRREPHALTFFPIAGARFRRPLLVESGRDVVPEEALELYRATQRKAASEADAEVSDSSPPDRRLRHQMQRIGRFSFTGELPVGLRRGRSRRSWCRAHSRVGPM
uniref:Uncharacterized protein n=1 Tax=Aegilops tauschii subsp. strangulata TaxID=200361 RepID=A0A453E9H5_AEGTS